MYILTIVIAGGIGIGILIEHKFMQWTFGAECPEIVSFLVGSVFIAFALLSILGLKAPVRFAPILLMQLIYKTIWLLSVMIFSLTNGKLEADIIPLVIVFAAVIIGDVMAIPFSEVFGGLFKPEKKDAAD